MTIEKQAKFGSGAAIVGAICLLATLPTVNLNTKLFAILGLLGTVLMLPAFWGFYRFFGRVSSRILLLLCLLVAIAGILASLAYYLLALSSDIYDPATAVLIQSAFLLSTIFFAANILQAWISLASPGIPKWPGWLGISAGFMAMTWICAPSVVPTFVPIVGNGLVYLWLLILGAITIRSPIPAPIVQA
jgi:hypothetical protein